MTRDDILFVCLLLVGTICIGILVKQDYDMDKEQAAITTNYINKH